MGFWPAITNDLPCKLAVDFSLRKFSKVRLSLANDFKRARCARDVWERSRLVCAETVQAIGESQENKRWQIRKNARELRSLF